MDWVHGSSSDCSLESEDTYPEDIPECDREAIMRRSRQGPIDLTIYDYDVVGTLDDEEGLSDLYPNTQEFDSTSHLNWRTRCLYMVRMTNARPLIQGADGWRIVSDLSENHLLVQRSVNSSLFLRQGNIPHKTSTSETQKIPCERLWHGRTLAEHRAMRNDQQDLLNILRNVSLVEYGAIYIVLSVVPLRVIDMNKPKPMQ